MNPKILITIQKNGIAPRFDLTAEVFIVSLNAEGGIDHRKSVVLPTVSAEALSHLIITEGVTVVICGAIEEQYYQYLSWKKVRVIDSVIGPYERALELALAQRLECGSNVLKQPVKNDR